MRKLPRELHTWMAVGGEVDFSGDKVVYSWLPCNQ